MATQITVNVDRGGLLERNKQQTAANRQARLEQDRRQEAAQAGGKERDKQRAQATTTPLSTLPKARLDQPAASRLTSNSLYLGPAYAPQHINGRYLFNNIEVKSEDWYVLQTRKNRGDSTELLPTRIYAVAHEYEAGEELRGNSFLPTGGPSNSSAIRLSSDYVDNFLLFATSEGFYVDPPERIAGLRCTFELYCLIETAQYNYFYIDLDAFSLRFQLSAAGSSQFSNRFDTSASTTGFEYAWPFDNWVHVAVTYNAGTWRLYLDGTNVAAIAEEGSQQDFRLRQLGYDNPYNAQQRSVLIHGVKATNRVLYFTNFIPPASIKF